MMLAQVLPFATPLNFAAVVVILVLLRSLVRGHVEKRKIAKLGDRAALHRAWLPFGIDIALEAIWESSHDRKFEYLQSLFVRSGTPASPYTVEFRVMGERVIYTAEPDNIKAILATQFGEFGKGDEFNKNWKPFLGDSIFSTDGQLWHDSRSLIRPQFIKDRVSDLVKFETHVQALLGLLRPGQTFEIVDLFHRFTLDAATDFLLGRSVGSLHYPQVKFAKSFANVQYVHATIAFIGYELGFLVPRGTYHKDIQVINEFLEPFIEHTLGLPTSELEKLAKSDHGYTFLHALAGYTRDRRVLRDQMVAVLLAGRDTTACTLSWLFYELSRHPEVLRRLRQEVIDVVGLSASPTYENLKSMRYLQHTLNETLRLYPAVPMNVRVALADTSLPRGGGPDGSQPVGVLKGTNIGYSTLSLHLRPDLYPDPSTGFPPVADFVPDRWERWTPKSWTYIPFNGGPRICVGQQFALTEMGYVAVRFLQRFARIESRQSTTPSYKTDVTLLPGGGVRLAFFEDSGMETKA